MRGIDTNILLRYLTGDDEAQSPRALAFMTGLTAANPGFVSTIALVELFWTLKSAFTYSREDICRALDPLLHVEELVFEHRDAVQYAFHLYRGGRADFADALLGRVSKIFGCDTTYTFDRGAAVLTDFTEL